MINADLLKKDGNSESFDFDAFFNKVFKESALKKMNEQYKVLSDNKSSVLKKHFVTIKNVMLKTKTIQQLKLKLNLYHHKSKMLKIKLNELGDKISTYEDLKYDDSMFSNLQTKAK